MEDVGVVVQFLGEERGRGLVATRDFRKGETLFREKPLVSAQFDWNRAAGYRACDNCMEPLETAQENVTRLTGGDQGAVLPHTTECCPTKPGFHVVCPSGCGAAYCSAPCMDEALTKHHGLLCLKEMAEDQAHPLNVLLDVWKGMHYPPETTSITLMVRILAGIAQCSTEAEAEAAAQKYLNTFTHGTRETQQNAIHKILGDQFLQQLEVLRSTMEQVFGSLKCRNPAAIQWFLTPEGFQALFAMVGRNGQGIGSSPLAQWVKKVEKLQSRMPAKKDRDNIDALIDAVYAAIDNFAGLQFLNNEGSGLYLLHSAANHSCEPNAVVEFPFNNHELVLNASREIREGEEVLISYLDECDRERSRHSRRKALLQNYLFNCECPKCCSQVGDPDVTSDEEMTSSEDEDEDD